ncbi:hypothetical protein HYT23_04570 [Candidatus Pacearchaeota archaeon]|nr:hypothetical protein [Candidatus Pacearchaeota archaeon]
MARIRQFEKGIGKELAIFYYIEPEREHPTREIPVLNEEGIERTLRLMRYFKELNQRIEYASSN